MKKILLFGPEVTDFLNPLANKLMQLGYTVDLLENRKFPRSSISINQSYSTVLNYHKIVGERISFAQIIKYLFTKEFINNYFKELSINCLEGKCRIVKSFKNCMNQQLLKERFSPILNKYDIINFHSISPGTLAFIRAINPDKKIMLSFWGSDLYQVNGLKNYYDQFEGIKRADSITVMSYEMELMVLAKFGSDLKNKIVRTLLGIKDEMYELLDEAKRSPQDLNFLKKFDIPENKIKITVGYCGNPICNHLLILNELDKIEDTKKENIHLFVPMTYGNYSNDYFEEVRQNLIRTKISFTLFREFLTLDEVIKLRVTSDIMIMMNNSDALSGSVNEALYADNILISAIWLPYSPFRLKKIFFLETDFAELCETVSYAIDNIDRIKAGLVGNANKVKSVGAVSQNLQTWISTLDSLQ